MGHCGRDQLAEDARREGESDREHVDEKDLGDAPREDKSDDGQRARRLGRSDDRVDIVANAHLGHKVEAQ